MLASNVAQYICQVRLYVVDHTVEMLRFRSVFAGSKPNVPMAMAKLQCQSVLSFPSAGREQKQNDENIQSPHVRACVVCFKLPAVC
jgi:hypothetical protein